MTRFKVLETNILHASDVIHWLDGTSAEEEARMSRLDRPVALQLSQRPPDLHFVHGPGKTAFWRRPDDEIIDGEASDDDKRRPDAATFVVAGEVFDPSTRFNPRRFSLELGASNGHAIVLYPSPVGTRFGASGGVIGSVRLETAARPLSWALVTLTVTTAFGDTLTFRAQASAHGDFLLPTRRLPPLPESIDDYVGTLSVSASLDADPQAPVDPADFVALGIGQPGIENTFLESVEIRLVPGEVRPIRSFGRDYLSVQPV